MIRKREVYENGRNFHRNKEVMAMRSVRLFDNHITNELGVAINRNSQRIKVLKVILPLLCFLSMAATVGIIAWYFLEKDDLNQQINTKTTARVDDVLAKKGVVTKDNIVKVYTDAIKSNNNKDPVEVTNDIKRIDKSLSDFLLYYLKESDAENTYTPKSIVGTTTDDLTPGRLSKSTLEGKYIQKAEMSALTSSVSSALGILAGSGRLSQTSLEGKYVQKTLVGTTAADTANGRLSKKSLESKYVLKTDYDKLETDYVRLKADFYGREAENKLKNVQWDNNKIGSTTSLGDLINTPIENKKIEEILKQYMTSATAINFTPAEIGYMINHPEKFRFTFYLGDRRDNFKQKIKEISYSGGAIKNAASRKVWTEYIKNNPSDPNDPNSKYVFNLNKFYYDGTRTWIDMTSTHTDANILQHSALRGLKVEKI